MMCPLRAETFRLCFAAGLHRPSLKGMKFMQKSSQWVGKLLWTQSSLLLTALFRGITTFPQHFQKYLLLQRDQRGADEGRWGQARRDLQHGCNWSFCFVSVELIKWINGRLFFFLFFFSGNAFPSTAVMVRSWKKEQDFTCSNCIKGSSLQVVSLNKYF